MVADTEKKKIQKVRKTHVERSNTSLLKDEIRNRFGEKVIEIVDIEVTHMWGHLKKWVMVVWHEVCGKKRRRRSKSMHGVEVNR